MEVYSPRTVLTPGIHSFEVFSATGSSRRRAYSEVVQPCYIFIVATEDGETLQLWTGTAYGHPKATLTKLVNACFDAPLTTESAMTLQLTDLVGKKFNGCVENNEVEGVMYSNITSYFPYVNLQPSLQV